MGRDLQSTSVRWKEKWDRSRPTCRLKTRLQCQLRQAQPCRLFVTKDGSSQGTRFLLKAHLVVWVHLPCRLPELSGLKLLPCAAREMWRSHDRLAQPMSSTTREQI